LAKNCNDKSRRDVLYFFSAPARGALAPSDAFGFGLSHKRLDTLHRVLKATEKISARRSIFTAEGLEKVCV
jgi:hypothetical protein